jgi:hypothetical protein
MKTIKTTIAVLFATFTLAACSENQPSIKPMHPATPQSAQTNTYADSTDTYRTAPGQNQELMRVPNPGETDSRPASANGSGSGNGLGVSSVPATPRTDTPIKTVMPADTLAN